MGYQSTFGGLGDPVLDEIRAALAASGLTIREQLYLALGAAALGDHELALAVERDLLGRFGERLGPWLRLRVGRFLDDTIEATALVALIGATVGDPAAEWAEAYVEENRAADDLFNLQQVGYLARVLERTPAEAATVTYAVAGIERTVDIEAGDAVSLTLTPAQAATLTARPAAGRVGVAVSWDAPVDPASLAPDPSLTLGADGRARGIGSIRPARGGDPPRDLRAASCRRLLLRGRRAAIGAGAGRRGGPARGVLPVAGPRSHRLRHVSRPGRDPRDIHVGARDPAVDPRLREPRPDARDAARDPVGGPAGSGPRRPSFSAASRPDVARTRERVVGEHGVHAQQDAAPAARPGQVREVLAVARPELAPPAREGRDDPLDDVRADRRAPVRGRAFGGPHQPAEGGQVADDRLERRRIDVHARHAGRVEAQRDIPARCLVRGRAGHPGVRGHLALGMQPPLGEIHERATLRRHREVRRPRRHEVVTEAERDDVRREARVDLRGGRDLDVAGEEAAALEPRAQLRQACRSDPAQDEREREAAVRVPGGRQDAPVRVDAEHRGHPAGRDVGIHEDAGHDRVVDDDGRREAGGRGRWGGRGRGRHGRARPRRARRDRRARCRGGVRCPDRARRHRQGEGHAGEESPEPTRPSSRHRLASPSCAAAPATRCRPPVRAALPL